MNYLGWNCLELGNPRTVRCLRDLIKTRHLDLVFLSETLVNAEKFKELSIMLGFSDNFVVDSVV